MSVLGHGSKGPKVWLVFSLHMDIPRCFRSSSYTLIGWKDELDTKTRMMKIKCHMWTPLCFEFLLPTLLIHLSQQG
ncbi:hypothetical protein L207DRAFT_322647 [Hyaloscypha variabilis F]|uniref:Uncharacterized protein n=1 Tax=Hyaloscypha variabilis (strain UAMH 11265 / GT02V1 / F) TaxID=1149755 RepID=A0A2J6RRZ3_HYAVF|nr:hypothetical protein L207DRAFT_322647 [Hyaloscypha variabilis F]